MKSHKLLYVFIIIVFIIIILAIIYNIYFKNKLTLKVNIINKTSSKISGLKLTSTALTKSVEIPAIPEKGKYKVTILSSKNYDESNLDLYYLDKQGNTKKIGLIEYFKKGYNESINISINSVNSNGILSVITYK